jgi:UDP-glucose 4-epimerase
MVFSSSAEVYGDYEGVMTEDVMEKNLITFRHISDERLCD